MATPGAQAALELAVRDALRTYLGYQPPFCDRSFNDQPPPRCGQWFAAVWSGGDLQPGPSVTTCLDVYHSVTITVTVRLVQPFDRWAEHRDFLEQKTAEVAAYVADDRRRFVIVNAANALAGFRDAGVPDGTHAIGFCEGLVFQGRDVAQMVGPEHFHAELDKATSRDCGIAQAVRFGRCRRVQAFATAG